MENKNLYWGLGALALVGLGAYLYANKKPKGNKLTDKTPAPAPTPVLKEDKTPEIISGIAGRGMGFGSGYGLVPSARVIDIGGQENGINAPEIISGVSGQKNNQIKNIGYGRNIGTDSGYGQVQPIVIVDWGVDGAVTDTNDNVLFYGSAPKHFGADGFHYPAKATLDGGFYGIAGRKKFKRVYANEALREIPKRSLGEGKMWCCSERDPSGNCTTWEQRPTGSPCDNNA